MFVYCLRSDLCFSAFVGLKGGECLFSICRSGGSFCDSIKCLFLSYYHYYDLLSSFLSVDTILVPVSPWSEREFFFTVSKALKRDL